jgi:2-polyprenyl-3-methyl-5-hydroxy-6-metoxy-1,4-benzoquinol methylase
MPQTKFVKSPCRIKSCQNFKKSLRYKGVVDPISEELFNIIECSSCKNHFTDPVPNNIDRYYPNRYRNYGKITFFLLNFFYKRNVKNWIKQFGDNKSVLEVGCGTGFMLSIFKKNGWKVFGIERNEQVAKKAKELYCIDVSSKNLKDINGKKFDLILLFNVLEHVDDPISVVNECAKKLNKNGEIVIKVPNFDSWQSRIMGKYWFHLDVPRHLFHFNTTSLKKIIDDSKLSCNFKSSVSFEHDPYGMFESIMSIIFKKSNIFTNFLMGIGRFSFRIPLIVLFGALLFLPIVTFSALSWIFNKGAIMEARAKKI